MTFTKLKSEILENLNATISENTTQVKLYQDEQVKQIWQRALNVLANNLKKPSFDTWIRPIKLVNIENDTAIIAAKNEFSRNFIFQTYHKEIELAIKEASAHSLAIRYVVDTDLKIEENDTPTQQVSLASIEKRKPNTGFRSQLNFNFTFANFVEDASNKAALTFAKAIIENHSGIYNSLFIISETGLGKTHLLHAIGNYALGEDPDTRVRFVNAEEFTNQLISSIQKNKTQDFRNQYRNIDVLLFDDFQFLDNKKVCQEEFIYTFEAIISKGGKVIIASNKEFKDFKYINKKLESRVRAALFSPINKPSYSARVKILTTKARDNNIDLNNKHLNTIASKFNSNVRELEGALMQISAFKNYASATIDDELIANLFGGLAGLPMNKGASIDSICKQVAEHFGVDADDITGKRRLQDFARARHIAIYLSYRILGISYARIGEHFGGRKHSSVIHSIKTVESLLNSNLPSSKSIKALVEQVIQYYN